MPISLARLQTRRLPGPSAQAWFAAGERVGYDPGARAIVAAKTRPSRFS